MSQVVEMWQPKYPPRILHAGMHRCEERDAYEAAAAELVVWVDANPALIADACGYLCQPRAPEPHRPTSHRVVRACLSDREGEVTFHVAEDSQESSILGVGVHPVTFVEDITMTTTTIDALCRRLEFQPTMLNCDIQGAELLALHGAWRVLAGTEVVYTEVSEVPIYEGAPHWSEIDTLLREAGFRLAHVEMTRGGEGWGDALWIRKGCG